MPNQLPALLKAAEVAELLRVHENTIYTWANDGTLPSIRLGSTVRFRRSDIERLLNNEQTA